MNLLLERKILITGANGFIGRHLCSELINEGAQVGAIDLQPGENEQLQQYAGSLTDKGFVQRVCEDYKPDIVIHLAAFKDRVTSIESFQKAIDVNLQGTLNLVESLIPLKGFQRFIAMGTAEEYGLGRVPFEVDQRELPISSYSFSKTAMTHMLQTIARSQAFPSVVIRPSVAYGPGQQADMFLPALIGALLQNREFKMTAGAQKRDFVFVDDLVSAIIGLASADVAPGSIFNVGNGESISIADVAVKIGEKLDKSHLIKLGEYPDRVVDIQEYALDTEPLQVQTGWSPKISLDEGLDKTIAFMKMSKDLL